MFHAKIIIYGIQMDGNLERLTQSYNISGLYCFQN